MHFAAAPFSDQKPQTKKDITNAYRAELLKRFKIGIGHKRTTKLNLLLSTRKINEGKVRGRIDHYEDFQGIEATAERAKETVAARSCADFGQRRIIKGILK